MISPFAGIKNAALESKNMRQNGWKVFSICAIALIPLIYAGLFLLAFLDPYGNLNQVPAAVVIEDKGSVVSSEKRNVGKELYASLLENNENKKEGEASGFNWQQTSRSQAIEGLKDGDYYMVLIVPKDFTKNIASADSDDPQKAKLEVYFNPSTNLIASTVGNSMVTKIKAELDGKIQKEYYDNIFVQLTKASDQLLDAVDGATQLDEGLESAKDGSNTITVNLTTLSDGATTLEAGLQQLDDGTTTLASGASKLEAATAANSELASGSSTLTEGLGTLESSVSTLPQSTTQLANGIDTLVSSLSTSLGNKSTSGTLIYGSDAVSQGASALSSGLSSLSENSAALTSGSAKISGGLASLKEGSDTFKSTVDAAKQQAASAADINAATSEYQTALVAYTTAVATNGSSSAEAKAALATLGEKVTALTTASGNAGAAKALTTVESGYTALDAGITELESGYNGDGTRSNPGLNASLSTYTAYVDSAAQSAPTLASGAAQVNQGLNTMQSTLTSKTGSVAALSTGAHQLASASPALTSAITSAKNGSAAITAGIGTLNSNIKTLSGGAWKLKSGAASAASGSQQIASGATQLAEGSQTLTDGLTTAKDGMSQLKDGLVDGQEEMANNVENSDAKTEMMSEPVSANGESEQGENITTVKNYGTGFAPYFIALGMWVGCLMITFLLRSLNGRILMSKASSFAAVLSSYLPMACIALIQVFALLALIQFGLGFNINFVPQYYAFGVLVALAFMAIIQLLRAWFGTPGMVIIIVLLMLQLCTAAGTFPIEAEIDLFNWLNPFLPMTYVVKGFRIAMCGLDPSYMTSSVVVLLGFLVGALALSTFVASRRRYATMATLYPKIKMAEA